MIPSHKFIEFGNAHKLFGLKSHENFLQRSKNEGFVKSINELMLRWPNIRLQMVELYKHCISTA